MRAVGGRYPQEIALIVTSNRRDQQELENVLADADYHVLAAASTGEALELCRHFAGAIHLLVTEANSPGDSGWTLAEAATKVRPGIVVLFLSPKTSVGPDALLRIAGTLARQTQRQGSRRVN
jgi:DNA-binding response OmpR family regulator